MSEGVISKTRDLIAGVERERRWVMAIGLMGIVFSVVFAAIMLVLYALRPAGLFERGPYEEALRPIIQVSIWLFGICSVISIVASVKVLNFIRTWHKSYLNLKAAEKTLDKKYFSSQSLIVKDD